jgi:hypothetical protein
MPGLTWVQSNVAYYGVSGSGGNLPCAFGSANAERNIGIAWITADSGAGPATCTDTNGNVWYEFPGYFTNSGFSTLYVCPYLKAGPNTVTIGGLVPPSAPGAQSPVLTILEYAVQGCAPCGVGFQALQAALACNGVLGTWYQGSVLTMESLYSASGGVWYHTLLAFINTTPADGSGIARTWQVNYFPAYYVGPVPSVREHYEDTGTLETGAVADSTVPYPYAKNFITFVPTPAPPPPAPWPGPNTQLFTAVIGLLISTQG